MRWPLLKLSLPFLLAPSAILAQDIGKTDRYGDPLPQGAVARLGTARMRQHNVIMSVALSPDGKTVASAGAWTQYDPNEAIRLWDLATGKQIRELPGHTGYPRQVLFSPDGKTVASVARSGAAADGWLAQDKRTKKVPLDLVYSTSPQKGLKRVDDNIPEFRRDKIAVWFRRWAKVGASDVFLVRGDDFVDALEATRWAMDSWISADEPVRRMDMRDISQQIWLVGYLGVGRQSPPAWVFDSVEINDGNIRLIYRQTPSTGEKERPYLVWVSLGNLAPGSYSLQLFDKDAGEYTLTRRVFVPSTTVRDTRGSPSRQDASKQPLRNVPLEMIYAIGGQKGLKSVLGRYSFPRGPSNILLVRGEEIDDAVAATTSVLASGESVVRVVGSHGVRSNKTWLAAYFGTAGSGSPWIVKSLEIHSRKICLHYQQLDGTANDLQQYLIWAPLGELPAGTYTLDLVDDDRDVVTLSRRVAIRAR